MKNIPRSFQPGTSKAIKADRKSKYSSCTKIRNHLLRLMTFAMRIFIPIIPIPILG